MVNNNRAKPQGTTPEATNTAAGTQTSGWLTQKSVLDEEAQDIQNSTEAHNYLKQCLLIVPPGEVPTAGLLAIAQEKPHLPICGFKLEYARVSTKSANISCK